MLYNRIGPIEPGFQNSSVVSLCTRPWHMIAPWAYIIVYLLYKFYFKAVEIKMLLCIYGVPIHLYCIHCKNNLVVLSTGWLYPSYRRAKKNLVTLTIANCTRQLLRNHILLPGSCVSNNWGKGHICLYQKVCNNNHNLADIVTTEHLISTVSLICLKQR